MVSALHQEGKMVAVSCKLLFQVLQPVCFFSRCSLRAVNDGVEIHSEEQKCVVYRVPCECGSVYVGETGRQMKTRNEEHKRAVMKADPNNAIAEHVRSTGQKIQWDETTSIDHDGDWFRRRVKDALYIRSSKP